MLETEPKLRKDAMLRMQHQYSRAYRESNCMEDGNVITHLQVQVVLSMIS